MLRQRDYRVVGTEGLMVDLKLDLDAMDDAKTNLSVLRSEILGIGDFSAGGAAEAAGHLRLGLKISSFVSAWSIRRDEIAEQMQFVADAAGAISSTFRELDTTMAQILD
jgi:hypothetical protein